jgi:hypothetical protein
VDSIRRGPGPEEAWLLLLRLVIEGWGLGLRWEFEVEAREREDTGEPLPKGLWARLRDIAGGVALRSSGESGAWGGGVSDWSGTGISGRGKGLSVWKRDGRRSTLVSEGAREEVASTTWSCARSVGVSIGLRLELGEG